MNESKTKAFKDFKEIFSDTLDTIEAIHGPTYIRALSILNNTQNVMAGYKDFVKELSEAMGLEITLLSELENLEKQYYTNLVRELTALVASGLVVEFLQTGRPVRFKNTQELKETLLKDAETLQDRFEEFKRSP